MPGKCLTDTRRCALLSATGHEVQSCTRLRGVTKQAALNQGGACGRKGKRHPSNSCHEEDKRSQVLARIRRKGNPRALLVGLQMAAPTMEGPQKLTRTAATGPANPLLGAHPREMKAGYPKESCPLLFTAAWLTTAGIWKQPKRLSTDEDDVV